MFVITEKVILHFAVAVFCIICLIFPNQDAKANEIEVKRDGLYAVNIPEEVFQSVEEYVNDWLVDSILEHKELGSFEGLEEIEKVEKDSKFLLCKPYTVWNIETGKGENTAFEYHFPVVCDDRVIAEVEASKGLGDSTPGGGGSRTFYQSIMG